MTLSLTLRPSLPVSRDFQFVAAMPGAPFSPLPERTSKWVNPWRYRQPVRGPAHALLADGQGVWAWSPSDPHAEATRHASLQEWITAHPGCDIGLWVSGQLVHSLERDAVTAPLDDAALRSNARRELVDRHGNGAAEWALATWKNNVARGVCALTGIDLDKLNQFARGHGVRMQFVAPWWYHAFQEARQCVDALNHARNGHVCVVEGRQIAWVATTNGLLTAVRQITLNTACIADLRTEIDKVVAQAPDRRLTLVVLGQGIEDGSRTNDLNALVLGRLDGVQPPQWLRPSFQRDMH